MFETLDKDGNKTLDREEYTIFVKLVLGHDAGVLKQEVRSLLAVPAVVSLVAARSPGRAVWLHCGHWRGEDQGPDAAGRHRKYLEQCV